MLQSVIISLLVILFGGKKRGVRMPDTNQLLQLSGKCVIPVVCVKLGNLYVVKHNFVT